MAESGDTTINTATAQQQQAAQGDVSESNGVGASSDVLTSSIRSDASHDVDPMLSSSLFYDCTPCKCAPPASLLVCPSAHVAD